MDGIKPPKKVAPKPEPVAVTPEPAEVEEPINNLDEPIVIDEAELDKKPEKPPKASRFAFVHRWKAKLWDEQGRRGKILTAVSGIIILAALVFGIYVAFFHQAKIPNSASIKKHPVKASLNVPSPLSGVLVNPLLAKRPITGVMVENSHDARPQSGLQDAGVVYEAIAEAGITRFLTLYQEGTPQYVGPVRSLRPYYIDWATPFDASIAHVGGSPAALSQIRSGGKDLDQFFNSASYWRQATRPAPHNVYTSFNLLDALNESKGYTTSKLTSWDRKKDSKLKLPTVKSIDFSISSLDFNVHYDYDPVTNTYARSEGGHPHIVTVSESDTAGVQLKPKVVIALITSLGNGELDASGAYYSDYTVSGSGQALVFQDGGVTIGNWSKADRASQIQFTNSTGVKIKLNAGQTWITVLSDPSLVKYTP